MEPNIKEIPKKRWGESVEIFTEAFMDDPLFLFAFPEIDTRKRLTKIMYEFVVYDMVPALNLVMNGAFLSIELAGCQIYRTPESFGWNELMNSALEKMRAKANDERINLIGEYATLSGYDPAVVHFYGNELAVKKEFRRSGIGRALSNFMINECRTHPTAKGTVIDTANEKNVRLYEKWGWELKMTLSFYEIKKFFMWRAK
jgi:GNAT superfamily N-acetyltransferase